MRPTAAAAAGGNNAGSEDDVGGGGFQDDQGGEEGAGIAEALTDNEPPGPRKDATWFSRELCKISCFGNISDTCMEKITKLFMDNADDISDIHRRGEVSSSYRHTIKKRLNIWQPGFRSAIKYVDLDDPEAEPVVVENLRSIPKKYLNPRLDHNYRLLRTESYTTLKDIKRHYEATHPNIRGEKLANAYKYAAVGIDGVREANSGSRNLYVVSIMFAGCVFLWRVYSPMKSCAGAKPTLEELLR